MTWPPSIADELPAPRDDEPPELRHDIADELADHLSCSLNRELHRTPDETSAKRNVIDRFGDPVQIARKLWFDALKEKIMSQRIVVTAAVLLALAGFASTGMTWLIIRQTRELNEQLLAESRSAAEQSRAANQALLDKLVEFANRKPAEAAAPKSMEWNPVKFRLSSEKTGGPPAVGFTIRLQGYLLDTAKEIRVDRTTGDDGTADFGLVRPGQHHYIVTAPWGESLGVFPATAEALAQRRGNMGSSSRDNRVTNRLTVLPGESMLHEVICPAATRREAEIKVTVNWPDDLLEKKLWTIVHLQLQPRQVGKIDWQCAPQQAYQFALIGPGQELMQFPSPGNSEASQSLSEHLFNNRPGSVPGGKPAFPGLFQDFSRTSNRPERIQNFALALPEYEVRENVRWAAGDYRILNLAFLQAPAESSADQLSTFPLVFGIQYSTDRSTSGRYSSILSNEQFSQRGVRREAPEFVLAPAEIPLLTARDGEQTAWKVSLPPALADQVRQSLTPPEQAEKNTSF